MAVSEDRKYSKRFVYQLLEGIKGKTLGEVDSSRQFDRTLTKPKITGIAGDVIEQSVFGYARDFHQECDIEIDGVLTELKTTGVRIPKSKIKLVKNKEGEEYNFHFMAKEGISITGVTFEPTIQLDFLSSHFWEKSERLLIVFYEYKSYDVVPASKYADFRIVDYCYNTFSESERSQLCKDWEIVRDYLKRIYDEYPSISERYAQLVGFTHKLRSQLLLVELVPGFSRKEKDGKSTYTRPRYRLKKTFVDYIVQGHFQKNRKNNEICLAESFNSFSQLDNRCHELSKKFSGKTLWQLKDEFGIEIDISAKHFNSICILKMFAAPCKRLNQISDFTKAGIIAKTITLTPKNHHTEDMKLQLINFEEWANRDVDFEESEIYNYFSEHSFLCPIFREVDSLKPELTTFLGFKRFSFDDDFIYDEVKRVWDYSRYLIHSNELVWEYVYDNDGNIRRNQDGELMGAPNFPKSSDYKVFFRGGNTGKSSEGKTECVNGIYMLPQYFWLKGTYIVDRLNTIDFI